MHSLDQDSCRSAHLYNGTPIPCCTVVHCDLVYTRLNSIELNQQP